MLRSSVLPTLVVAAAAALGGAHAAGSQEPPACAPGSVRAFGLAEPRLASTIDVPVLHGEQPCATGKPLLRRLEPGVFELRLGQDRPTVLVSPNEVDSRVTSGPLRGGCRTARGECALIRTTDGKGKPADRRFTFAVL